MGAIRDCKTNVRHGGPACGPLETEISPPRIEGRMFVDAKFIPRTCQRKRDPGANDPPMSTDKQDGRYSKVFPSKPKAEWHDWPIVPFNEEKETPPPEDDDDDDEEEDQ